jgi:hypothetical protein
MDGTSMLRVWPSHLLITPYLDMDRGIALFNTRDSKQPP